MVTVTQGSLDLERSVHSIVVQSGTSGATRSEMTSPLAFRDARLPEKFWSLVSVVRGCWVWSGPVSPTGAPKFQFDGKHDQVHTALYRRFVAELDRREQLVRTCSNRLCVNPAHLRRKP